MSKDANQNKQNLQNSIRNRFASLGVQLGAEGISSQKKKNEFLIESVVDGQIEKNQFGTFFSIQTTYPVGTLYGNQTLEINMMPESIYLTLTPASNEYHPSDFIFIDTETSGLSGGVGTWVFMIGVVRQIGDSFIAKQFFMRNPAEERAMLHGFEQFIGDAKVIVSFNGKSFDVPMLRTRYQMQRISADVFDCAHFDLLHLSRRLWRYNLDDRRLGNLEVLKLSIHRTHEDVPGFIIPQLYKDYLISGDARPLKSVFYHNLVDIVSLVSLMKLLNQKFNFTDSTQVHHSTELYALAKHAETINMQTKAINFYKKALEKDLKKELVTQAQHNLARIFKRQKNWQSAMDIWETLSKNGDIKACEELAKAYEHRTQEFNLTITEKPIENNCDDKQRKISNHQNLKYIQSAISWTQKAINLASQSSIESSFWLDELNHRLHRLEEKTNRIQSGIQKEKQNEEK